MEGNAVMEYIKDYFLKWTEPYPLGFKNTKLLGSSFNR